MPTNDMNKPSILVLQSVAVLVLAWSGRGSLAAPGEPAVLSADALKADPWVSPPRTPQETEARVSELRAEYAKYLRSLPTPVDVRQRRELRGPWRSKYEVCLSVGGKRPAPPDWFHEDFDDSDWQTTVVPEWRWSPVQHGGRWYPVSCILWYRTRFRAGPMPPGRRIFLCFAGVDWEAEVWLNGTFLGRHKTYYEPFRFDITRLLKENNTLAVRVIDGPAFGEPISQWSLLPFVPGDAGIDQRYVLGDRKRSFPGYKFGTTSSLGSGFGIHREVFLETTGEAYVTDVFVRCNPADSQARVTVETDAAAAKEVTLELRALPENFEGPAYERSVRVRLPQGRAKQTFSLPMPGARWWWPADPCLYRCRVILRDGEQRVDAHDVLFGCRSFSIVSSRNPRPGLAEGTFLLNGRPVFLRGTNLSGALNAYWYWGERDKLLTAILMLKAANFNAVRACQHVSFPEVRELFDRLGVMSEQDQGSGYEIGHDVAATVAETGTVLARCCYNNPGVVLLSFANETHIDATAVVAATLAVDPDRIIIPVSGGTFRLSNPAHRDHVVGDRHPYEAWYGGAQLLWHSARTRTPERLYTIGEYGAEALDAYETMLHHYPKHWGAPPKPTDDALWGARQTGKGDDLRQQFGFRGKRPANLAQYIEASQNYQADVLAEATKGFRLSKRAVAGYFQFHFLDGTPAQWPKSIVSHDFRPKKGYYEMAQANQPLVPLYRLADEGATMEIWVVNDLAVRLPDCRVRWTIRAGDNCIEGESPTNVPASDAVLCKKVHLAVLPASCQVLQVALALDNARGQTLSRYERGVYRSFKFAINEKRQKEAEVLRRKLVGKVNVALRKPIMATSARDQSPAACAVDGNTRTGWAARDTRLPQSFTVDLGQVTPIVGARLIWQGNAPPRIEVHLSDDGQRWRPVSEDIESAVMEVPRAPLVFHDQYLVFAGKCRYVRIAITAVSAGDWPTLDELEVYANAKP